MPRSPAIVSIGSPGIRRISTNTSSVIPMKVGTTRLSRVKTNRSMPSAHRNGRKKGGGAARPLRPQHRLILDVDAVEGVASERRQLEVDHSLVDRLELHRMRNGEPRRLFLEDHLSLRVQLGALGLVADGLGLHDQI